MDLPGVWWLLLQGPANREPLRPYEQRFVDIWSNTKFSSNDLLPTRYLAVGVGVVLLIVAVVWLYRVYKEQRLQSAPLVLFRQAVAGMGLSMSEQWLLARITRHESLPSPLSLLCSPATLRHHALRYAHGQSAGARARTLAKVEHIARVVFGSSAGEPATPR
jgi:hypothetical protein